ncbi:MAG: porin, partial [Proteobacteria bacterium]|nr:porin [Pseudomonadota bacterium]
MDRKPIVMTLLLAALPFPSLAEDDLRALVKALSAQLSELNNQVKQSNQRIADLEKKLREAEKDKQQAAPPPAQASIAPQSSKTSPATASGGTATATGATSKEAKPAVTVGDTKGTFKIPGTNTSLGFGGMAKLDTNYSSISAGRDRAGDQILIVSQIPVSSARLGENSQTTFHAKDSRLWFKSFTPSSWGDINTFVELDFFGSSETYTYTPRVRHAYGSIGNFLGGFTWSTFLNTAAIPETLDNDATAGSLTNMRQPLVRWTQPFNWDGKALEFQAALEAPQSRFWADPE